MAAALLLLDVKSNGKVCAQRSAVMTESHVTARGSKTLSVPANAANAWSQDVSSLNPSTVRIRDHAYLGVEISYSFAVQPAKVFA
jgi:hypothetical protein